MQIIPGGAAPDRSQFTAQAYAQNVATFGANQAMDQSAIMANLQNMGQMVGGHLNQSQMAPNANYQVFTPERQRNRDRVIVTQQPASSDRRFEREDQWKMRNKTQLAGIKVQLNEKYTQINVMKNQKA